MTEASVEVATVASEKSKVAAELAAVKKEREDMSRMIQKLEKAKTDMEKRLSVAQEEAHVLKSENAASAARVTEVTKEKEELLAKLQKIDTTRTDIRLKLNEADEEVEKLKEEKNLKSRKVHEIRHSVHDRSMLKEAEGERRAISRDLQQAEDERERMRHMMQQLEYSRARLKGIINEDLNASTAEMSLTPEMIFPGLQQHRQEQEPITPSRKQDPDGANHEEHEFYSVSGKETSTESSSRISSLTHSKTQSTRYFGLQTPTSAKPALDRATSHRILDTRPKHQPTQTHWQSMNNFGQPNPSASTSSGWLAERILHQSARNMTPEVGNRPKRDPSTRTRSIDSNEYNNYRVRAKREKARESERRLREKMEEASVSSMGSGHSLNDMM